MLVDGEGETRESVGEVRSAVWMSASLVAKPINSC